MKPAAAWLAAAAALAVLALAPETWTPPGLDRVQFAAHRAALFPVAALLGGAGGLWALAAWAKPASARVAWAMLALVGIGGALAAPPWAASAAGIEGRAVLAPLFQAGLGVMALGLVGGLIGAAAQLAAPSKAAQRARQDRRFMAEALRLAGAQVGRTAPNPAVGCVIVRSGRIVAAAATGDGGRPHAEEAALARAGQAAEQAVAYVTLEPCAQRSQPGLSCTELLIKAGLARVVYAAADPHPKAAGQGPARLRAAGVIVESGLLAAQAEAQNAAFFAQVRADLNSAPPP